MEGRTSHRHRLDRHIATLYFLLCMHEARGGGGGGGRVVLTAQGEIEGRVVNEATEDLEAVDAFLGVAYAAPPVGRLRFMPPASPRAWSGINQHRDFKPVCPQILPKNIIGNESMALKYMTSGRLEYMRRLLPYLVDQSEDCLYLNIYAPRHVPYKSAVYVFLHGESYEWNSGNPYDGSVIAAYNSAIFITINYRLGILGFFKAGSTASANLGLLDQIAALLWIQENVRQFGGDPNSITLIGHGTGANLVSLLMISPVAKTGVLFQRAVLMSGSALSPDAMVSNAGHVTRQVAAQLNCPLSDEDLIVCLRNKEVQDLLSVQVSVPMHSIAFGPIVDGVIIPEQSLKDVMATNFENFDVMVGIAQSESLHMFPADIVKFGLESSELEAILRKYLTSVYGRGTVDNLITRIINEYDIEKQNDESINRIKNRNVLLEVFNDAKVVAPIILTAVIHSKANPGHTFLYKFDHVTENGFYDKVFGCIHGEDIPYILGMPLSGGSFHLRFNYTNREKVLSEVMMTALQNFAQFGNVSTFSSPVKKARYEQVAPKWQAFDEENETFISFDDNIIINSHYKRSKMDLWNGVFPDHGDGATDSKRNYPGLQENGHKADIAPTNLDKGDGLSGAASDKRRQKSSGSASGARTTAVTMRALILIGFILLFVNVCACAGVIYQKYRVRRRESRLREEVQVITDLLVSKEQSQLAHHVANTMKHANWEDKKVREITAPGTVGDKDCSRDGCFKTSSRDQVTLSNSGSTKNNLQPLSGNIVWRNGIEYEKQCRSIARDDPFVPNSQTVPNSHLTFPPKVSDELKVIPDINNRFLSLTSLSSHHQHPIQQKFPECQDCRIEEMDAKGDQIDVTTGLRPSGGEHQYSKRKFNFSKVIPYLPVIRSVSGTGKIQGRSEVTPPPTPIIEVVPLAEYEKLHPSIPKNSDPTSLFRAQSSVPPQLPCRKYGSLTKKNSFQLGNNFDPATFRVNGSKTIPNWLSTNEGADLTHIKRRYSPPTFGRLARNSRDHSNITSRRLKKDECAGGAALPAQISSSFTLEESDKMSIERNEAPANRPCRTIVLNNRSPSPPILSRVGDRSPPGTLNKVPYEENRIISCRNWCSRYSQSFLKKTIPPQAEEEELSISTDEHNSNAHRDQMGLD